MAETPVVDRPRSSGVDLLRFRLLRGFLQGRAYPLTLQVVLSLGFALIVFYGFVGPPHGEDNFGVAVTWRIWWLLLPFSFLLFARAWCAVCPLGAAGDLAQRLAFWPLREPGVLLRRGGAWVISISFFLLIWAGIVWRIDHTPMSTSLLLLVLLGAVVVTSLIFQRRAWCRYLCPLGNLAGLFSMLSFVSLRFRKQVCLSGCTRGRCVLATGVCHMYERPPALNSNRYCDLCAQCIGECKPASAALALRHPWTELAEMKRPLMGEVVFVFIIFAVGFLELLQTTPLYPAYMKWAVESFAASYNGVFSLSLFASMIVLIGTYLAASAAGGAWRVGGEKWATFGYVYLPLALASHLNAAVPHLVNHTPRAFEVMIGQLFKGLDPFMLPPVVRGLNYGYNLPIIAVQAIILAVGLWVTVYALRRLSEREAGVGRGALFHYVFAGVLALALGGLLLLPMGTLH